MIATIAKLVGISPALLWSLCMTETRLQNVINEFDGGSPSYGVCQVKVATAQMFNRHANKHMLQVPEMLVSILNGR